MTAYAGKIEHERVIAPIEDILNDARNGKPAIMIDDEDRENEGDLFIPAQFATPEIINFMIQECGGFVCLAMEAAMCKQLGLEAQPRSNVTDNQAKFLVSIEAKEGVSTGVSASDRARTIQTAIAADARPDDISTPGHVFPLQARDGGVLVRAGHTEACVDIAKLSGLRGAAVICEIMNKDGSMSRLDDLVPFAKAHNLKIGTIADLIAYRRRSEKLVTELSRETYDTPFGTFEKVEFETALDDHIHTALVKGPIESSKSALIRMHAGDTLSDLFGGGYEAVRESLQEIAKAEQGALVLLNTNRKVEDQSKDQALRRYGIGAQILRALGVRHMILLTRTERAVVGLEGYGLDIIEQRLLKGQAT